MDDLEEKLRNYALVGNARLQFYRFVNAIKEEKGFTEEIQKIQKIIDDIVLGKESTQFKKYLEAGTRCYRARIIKPEHDDKAEEMGIGITKNGEFVGYNDINSREPVLGVSGEGRNNIAGVSYLYIASNEETACMEIKSQFGDLISLATFELLEPLEVIDFASDKIFAREDTEASKMSMGEFFSILMMRYTEPVKDENEYRATQIISDYLRKTGIDGVAYRSFFAPGGTNYTIFNSHPSKIKFLGSRVLLHKQANHSFWDFNAETEIMSNRSGKMLAYDNKIAEDHKKMLSERFKTIEKK